VAAREERLPSVEHGASGHSAAAAAEVEGRCGHSGAERGGAALKPSHDHKGDDVVVLDCRNSYESDVGAFEGAVPLGTHTFKDTWGALERVLEGRDPRTTEVMIYCTGGIRCVKVGAYLKQHMGFERVARLQGGIVSYVRELKEKTQADEAEFQRQSLFRGINYVFDNRIGELVTPDVPLRVLPSSYGGSEPLVSDAAGRILQVPAAPPHPAPYALHPTPCTLHPTPCTLHPTP